MVIHAIRDLPERRQTEEALRQINPGLEQRVAERTLKLEEANKKLNAFAQSVSHDLRAPLRAMAGFGEFLTRECGGALGRLRERFEAVLRAQGRSI